MNLTGMVAIVRRNLRDEDSENYRWTDDELKRHIAHALSDLSEAIHYQQKVTIATVADSLQIDISSLTDLIGIVAVEYPIDESPRSYQRYSHWQDTITLLGSDIPDGSDCYIYYGKLHTLDADTSTIPTRYEELLATGAAGYALISWGAYSLNQVNLGGISTPSDFYETGSKKLNYFQRELKRLGKRNRVLISRLYTPATPIVSMDTDPGP